MTKKRIKTNIKFYKGLDNCADRLYGFVTKVNGSWRGCRDDVKKKKIVFIDSAVSDGVMPNVLYSCTLIPMDQDGGFIAISVSAIKFKAHISTTAKNGIYMIKISFGHKVVVYDPANPDSRRNDIQKIANMLRDRVDLKNAYQIAEDFITSACTVKRLYRQAQENV